MSVIERLLHHHHTPETLEPAAPEVVPDDSLQEKTMKFGRVLCFCGLHAVFVEGLISSSEAQRMLHPECGQDYHPEPFVPDSTRYQPLPLAHHEA